MSGPRILTSWSIPRKLVLFLVIVFLPASGIIVASSFVHRGGVIREAENKVLLLVQSLAAQQDQVAIGTKQMLGTLARLPMVQKLDAGSCNELFRDLNNRHPCYSTIAAATPDGKLFAASASFTPGSIDLSDRKHIRDAIRTLDFSAGESIVGKVSNVQSLNYTYPVLNANGDFVAIVIAGFKLDEYARFLESVNLPEGYAMTILDYRGMRLYRLPDNDAAVPGMQTAPETLELMSGDVDHGILERIGADGINRIYAFKRLHLSANSPPYLYMIIGLPKDKILHVANLHMFGNLSILGIAAICAMLLAWFFGNHVFVAPINQLVSAAQRFGKGELRSPKVLPHRSDELGQLAASFDEMASLLETRNVEREFAKMELQKANEELDARVAARTSELARVNESYRTEIVERKKAEAALQAALIGAEDEKSRSESIISSLSDGLTIIDRNFQIVFQNDISKTLMGTHVDEYCYRAFHNRDDVCEECHVFLCFADGGVHKKEVFSVRGDRTIYLEVVASPLKNTTSEVVGAIELIRDITVYRRAEEELKRSEQRLKVLFECAPDPYYLTDLDGRLVDANRAAEDITGYTKEEAIGRTFAELGLLLPDDIPRAFGLLAQNALGRPTGPDEFIVKRKDGKLLFLEERAFPTVIGGQTLVLGIARDITQRKQAEDSLRESERQLQSIIQGYPIPAFVIGKDHQVMYWNKALEDISHLKEREIVGTKQLWKAFYSTERPCMADLLVDEATPEAILHWYDGIYNKSSFLEDAYEATDFLPEVGGEGRWLHLTATPIRNSQGIVVGAIETVEDITARKKAEDALISANRQLNDIIEFFPDATVVVDMDRKVIAWNRAIEDMTGITKKEIIGKEDHVFTAPFYGDKRPYLLDLINARDEELESRYQHVMRKGGILYAQTHVPFLCGGKGAYVFATAAPLFDAHGNCVGAIEIIRDITEQRQAQEALRVSEEKYRELVENANSIILRMDNLGSVTFINEFAQRFFGYGEDEILGKNVVGTIVPPVETSGRDLRLMIEDIAVNPDRYAVNINENMRRGGERTWIAWTNKPIRYENGRVMEVLCVGNDITERKAMEEAVVEAEARYRSIFENALMGIFQSTPQGSFLKLNMALARILGYDSPEDALNAVTDLSRLYVNPERRSELVRLIEEREMVQDFEAQFFRKDKSVGWITLNIRAVRDIKGAIVHLEGTIQDITDSKLLESQLNQARKMEAIGTLAGGIAHDFNNILAPILGYSEISLNDVPKGSRLHHNLEQILLSGNRARELVKQILTFSRKTEQAPRPVQVSLLVKETLKLLRSSLPSTIEIRQSFDEDAIDSTVMADPIQIHQVLMNLCTNAAHAMREEGGVLSIVLKNEDIDSGGKTEIADLEPGAYLRLSVADTGHGMEEAIRERIFDPYFTTKGPSEGTGLGLALVYGIIKNLSGGIAVFSAPGQGSTFDVYFPRTKSVQAPIAVTSARLPTGKGLILVVDDEKPIVEMLREMLRSLGYDVAERYSSYDALQAFRAHPESFDLVITDLTMPHMTGLDLSKEILKIRANTPIILCTGFSEAVNENRIKSPGIREFLMKPVALRDLAVAVNRILSREKLAI